MNFQLTKQAFKDVERIRAKLVKAGQDIKFDTKNKVQEVGVLGKNYAYGLAPKDTGALRRAIRLEFPNENEFVIISSHPQGDILPIHLLFDTGQYSGITGQQPINPESLFFMQKTKILLEQEFKKRLQISFHHNIERIGK